MVSSKQRTLEVPHHLAMPSSVATASRPASTVGTATTTMTIATDVPIKFNSRMRILRPETDPKKAWLDHDNSRNPFLFGRNGCHWGQLKLFYTELEFLTLASVKHDLSKCTLVSVGAAPGHSVSLLRRMFPELRFILIDPATFFAKEDSHVKIMNTLFTDDTVRTILEDENNKESTILFVSDIRLTVDDSNGFEEAMFVDMVSQQRWSIDIGAAMSMFKFRMPFADAKTGPRDMRYDYKSLRGAGSVSRISLKKGVPADPSTIPRGTMVYLDGEIRLQLYPPSNSAETRLIVHRKPTGKYMLRAYDYDSYEKTMNHFNTTTRCAAFTYPHGLMLAEQIAGFDAQSYECACEAHIVSEYLRVVQGGRTPKPSLAASKNSGKQLQLVLDKPRELAGELFAIHRDMWRVTQRSLLSCRFGTPLAASKNNALERDVTRLMYDPSAGELGTVVGMRKALESAMSERIKRINEQILSFTALATQPQSTVATTVLRRTDYLAQMIWMRAELVEIERLRMQYRSILDRVTPSPPTVRQEFGSGRSLGRGRGHGHGHGHGQKQAPRRRF